MASISDIEKLLKTNNEVLRTDIKTDIDNANKIVIDAIGETLTQQQEQLNKLQKKITQMEAKEQIRDEKDLQREIKSRQHNIILNKVAESEKSQEMLLKNILELLIEATGKDIEPRDIDYIYRLGKKRNDCAPRPILIRFISQHLRNTIMQKFKFFNSKGVEIFEDFPKEIKEKRKTLFPLAKKIRENGLNALVKIDKLHVNGEIWSIAQAQEFLDDPQGEVQETAQNTQNIQERTKGKRGRPSPSNKSPVNEPKKRPNLNIRQPQSKTSVYTTPSPAISSPRINAPFVSTPQKNVQYTTIINED